ncbi:hypothetical protein GCM10028864_23840 [Microlunatus parietis]
MQFRPGRAGSGRTVPAHPVTLRRRPGPIQQTPSAPSRAYAGPDRNLLQTITRVGCHKSAVERLPQPISRLREAVALQIWDTGPAGPRSQRARAGDALRPGRPNAFAPTGEPRPVKLSNNFRACCVGEKFIRPEGLVTL